MSIIKKIASLFSIVFIPLMIPTYALLISLTETYLSFAETSAKITTFCVCFALTAVLPALVIYVLHSTGRIKDAGLNERTDRFIPIGVAIATYIATAIYLSTVNAPFWLTLFYVATAVSAAVMLLVSLKWKISGHAMGVGGLCAYTFLIYYRGYELYDNLWIFIATLLIAGIVCTSRLILNRHTLPQVVAGFFNGVLWISLTELLIM